MSVRPNLQFKIICALSEVDTLSAWTWVLFLPLFVQRRFFTGNKSEMWCCPSSYSVDRQVQRSPSLPLSTTSYRLSTLLLGPCRLCLPFCLPSPLYSSTLLVFISYSLRRYKKAKRPSVLLDATGWVGTQGEKRKGDCQRLIACVFCFLFSVSVCSVERTERRQKRKTRRKQDHKGEREKEKRRSTNQCHRQGCRWCRDHHAMPDISASSISTAYHCIRCMSCLAVRPFFQLASLLARWLLE